MLALLCLKVPLLRLGQLFILNLLLYRALLVLTEPMKLT